LNISKCPKCSKSIFQIESLTPNGSDKNIICVICHQCNSIVGTLDYFQIEEEFKETNMQIQIINKKLDTINQNIGQIINGIKLLANKMVKKE
jgi:hypothetical protein